VVNGKKVSIRFAASGAAESGARHMMGSTKWIPGDILANPFVFADYSSHFRTGSGVAFNLPFGSKKTTPALREQPGKGGSPGPVTDLSAPHTELSSLDFSNLASGEMEISEVGITSGIGAVFEDAAVLFANGKDRDAEHLLAAVLDDPANTAGEGLWMMLLDLYCLTGQREKFDVRVIDYARRFERSPPPWEDLSLQSTKRRGNAVPLFNLTGALAAPTSVQLQQLCSIGRKGGAIRIDLGKLRSVEDEGCTLLKNALAQLAADRVKVTVLGAAKLVTLLSGKVEAGVAEKQDIWMLLLEMLKYTGESARFEDLAVDYAVTFEVSPPSWESKVPLPSEEAALAEMPERSEGEYYLEGEVTGSSNEMIRKLTEFGAGRQTVVVECNQLRRLDFVAAGSLFNVLASLQAQGKTAQLINVSAMIGALMRVMSIDQVAQVMLRI
jgi:anti-anti-sigma regulatory factor